MFFDVAVMLEFELLLNIFGVIHLVLELVYVGEQLAMLVVILDHEPLPFNPAINTLQYFLVNDLLQLVEPEFLCQVLLI